ncbi:hypothetical protein [Synechocystis sp. PCC 7339]|nr:hypothetical protein [Synechocystis sp. PCC 7339]
MSYSKIPCFFFPHHRETNQNANLFTAIAKLNKNLCTKDIFP